MTKQTGLRIHITGVVQGVGFRPFVYGLATRFQLNGWVRNTSAGVDIEVDGEAAVLDEFTKALLDEAPPLSLIDELTATPQALNGFRGFEIVHSEAIADAFQPISPDVSICPDCLRELFDPEDHRYRYPFINCTNCGPRFTIIKDIPYDRPETTMAPFPMCGTCASEYQDPLDRRFHAQPVACPDCGPKVWLEIVGANGRSPLQRNVAILETQKLLGQGKILAIKGLGGFHLACDATNAAAVSELRRRKLRVDKPFALMMPDIATVEKYCFLEETERELLESIARPIVLLQRRPESPIAREIAPRQDSIGVMLPYTPLHYLLFAKNNTVSERSEAQSTCARKGKSGSSKTVLRLQAQVQSPSAQELDARIWNLPPLVMTSGNLSEEPIAYTNEDARERLSSLADAFLMHDRDIHIRCDDSVARVVEKGIYPLRRSRGYTPFPIKLPWEVPALLATGAELKNAFCITNQKYAFLSHHIGDLENYETLQSFEEGVSHFEKLFRVKPEAIAYDAHPNYLTTRYAQERTERDNVKTVAIQHHHAHIASCMAENGLAGDERVIGVALDGTGYGDDGNIWGGEFLLADYAGYERVAHLEYFPLAGGDAATKRPSRTALGLLWQLGLDWDANLASVQDQCSEERMALRVQLERKLNTPLTSSMGRLFDAAAALAGVRQRVNYEAQAAIEFEALADDAERGEYHFDVSQAQIQVRTAINSLVEDSLNAVPIPVISARFHNGIVNMVFEICIRLREKSGLNTVALSGGCLAK